jgi:hypothetical protein
MNRNCTLATETKTETMAAKPPPWPVSSGRRFPLLTRAEDAGFEPARAVNPTRFPSVRHRPLGESSARKVTGNCQRGRTGRDGLVTSASHLGDVVCRAWISPEG